MIIVFTDGSSVPKWPKKNKNKLYNFKREGGNPF